MDKTRKRDSTRHQGPALLVMPRVTGSGRWARGATWGFHSVIGRASAPLPDHPYLTVPRFLLEFVLSQGVSPTRVQSLPIPAATWGPKRGSCQQAFQQRVSFPRASLEAPVRPSSLCRRLEAFGSQSPCAHGDAQRGGRKEPAPKWAGHSLENQARSPWRSHTRLWLWIPTSSATPEIPHPLDGPSVPTPPPIWSPCAAGASPWAPGPGRCGQLVFAPGCPRALGCSLLPAAHSGFGPSAPPCCGDTLAPARSRPAGTVPSNPGSPHPQLGPVWGSFFNERVETFTAVF